MSAFPQIQTGITTQLPWTSRRRFLVSRIDQECGLRYAYYFDASAIAAFELNYSVLSSSELATLKDFWDSMDGAWGQFSFTDPDTGTTYTKCRFDGQTFDVTQTGPNEFSLRLVIVEFR